MSDLNEQLAQSLIQRNRDLIETHKQLLAVIHRMDATAKKVDEHVNNLRMDAAERERYVQYLESIIEKNGWNPNHA